MPSVQSSVRVAASPGLNVTLLLDKVWHYMHVKRYKTLFQPRETLSGHTGTTVHLSRIEGTNARYYSWYGSLTLSDGTIELYGREATPLFKHHQQQSRPAVKTNTGPKTIGLTTRNMSDCGCRMFVDDYETIYNKVRFLTSVIGTESS